MIKRIFSTLVLAATMALFAVAPAMGASKTVVLHVPDMCASNEIQAQTVLEEIRGVTAVKTDMNDYTVSVSFDDEKTTVEAFKDALKGVSLIVESVEEAE